MIFTWSDASNFEEEEEEEEAVDLNAALLDELDPEDLAVDEEIGGDTPVIPVPAVELDEEEGVDKTARAFFDGESEESEDEADLEYDSFDDKDDL